MPTYTDAPLASGATKPSPAYTDAPLPSAAASVAYSDAPLAGAGPGWTQATPVQPVVYPAMADRLSVYAPPPSVMQPEQVFAPPTGGQVPPLAPQNLPEGWHAASIVGQESPAPAPQVFPGGIQALGKPVGHEIEQRILQPLAEHEGEGLKLLHQGLVDLWGAVGQAGTQPVPGGQGLVKGIEDMVAPYAPAINKLAAGGFRAMEPVIAGTVLSAGSVPMALASTVRTALTMAGITVTQQAADTVLQSAGFSPEVSGAISTLASLGAAGKIHQGSDAVVSELGNQGRSAVLGAHLARISADSPLMQTLPGEAAGISRHAAFEDAINPPTRISGPAVAGEARAVPGDLVDRAIARINGLESTPMAPEAQEHLFPAAQAEIRAETQLPPSRSIASPEGAPGLLRYLFPSTGGDAQAEPAAAESPLSVRILNKDTGDQVFGYDLVGDAVRSWPQGKGTSAQLYAHLGKTRGAMEEAHEVGLLDWLKANPTVTRAEAEQFVKDHEITLHETQLGHEPEGQKGPLPAMSEDLARVLPVAPEAMTRRDWNTTLMRLLDEQGRARERMEEGEVDRLRAVMSEARAQRDGGTPAYPTSEQAEYPAGAPVYENYQAIRGGTNPRELLLSVPKQQGSDEAFFVPSATFTLAGGERVRLVRSLDGGDWEVQRQSLPGQFTVMGEAYMRARLLSTRHSYRAPHFSQSDLNKGLMAHARVWDYDLPDGRRILVAKELQSDWHQAGRDKGYQGDDPLTELPAGYTVKKATLRGAKGFSVYNANGQRLDFQPTEDAVVSGVLARLNENPSHVPAAPFRGNAWKKLMLQRLLTYARENGYAGVGWTTGAQQVKLWENELRKNVDRISWVGTERAGGGSDRGSVVTHAWRTSDQTQAAHWEPVEAEPVRIPSAPAGYTFHVYKDKHTKHWNLIEDSTGLAVVTHRDSVVDAVQAADETLSRHSLAEVVAREHAKNPRPEKPADVQRKVRKMAKPVVETSIRAEKNGSSVFSGTVGKDGRFKSGPAKGKTVEEVLGKEVAAKIASDIAGDLQGDNLTVGGEGMKGFYDRELPNLANDLVKKAGGRVTGITVPQVGGFGNLGDAAIHYLPLPKQAGALTVRGGTLSRGDAHARTAPSAAVDSRGQSVAEGGADGAGAPANSSASAGVRGQESDHPSAALPPIAGAGEYWVRAAEVAAGPVWEQTGLRVQATPTGLDLVAPNGRRIAVSHGDVLAAAQIGPINFVASVSAALRAEGETHYTLEDGSRHPLPTTDATAARVTRAHLQELVKIWTPMGTYTGSRIVLHPDANIIDLLHESDHWAIANYTLEEKAAAGIHDLASEERHVQAVRAGEAEHPDDIWTRGGGGESGMGAYPVYQRPAAEQMAEQGFAITPPDARSNALTVRSHEEGLRDEFMAAAKRKGYDLTVAESAMGMIDAVAKIFKEHADLLPNEGTKKADRKGVLQDIKAWVDNADFGKTADVDRTCKRVIKYWNTIEEVQRGIRRPMSENELIILGQEMRRDGDIPGCIFCYVEASRRAGARNAYAVAVKTDRQIADDYNKKASIHAIAKERRGLLKRLGWSLEDFAAKVVEPEDQRPTSAAAKALFKLYDDYVDASKATQRTGMGTYFGEVRRAKAPTLDPIRDRAGIRMWSATDLSPEQLVDSLQILADAGMMKMPAHGYTKEPFTVLIFGDTGVKINLSIAIRLNADGTVGEDIVNGMHHRTAMNLRSKHPNVGTMLVAKNMAELVWAMASHAIDMIIPHHAANWSGGVEKFGQFKLDNFDEVQHEHWASGRENIPKYTTGEQAGKKISPMAFYGKQLWYKTYLDAVKGDETKAVAAYLAFCKKNGIVPRFAAGTYTDHLTKSTQPFPDMTGQPGYAKLLQDYARTDSPQDPVDVQKTDMKAMRKWLDWFVRTDGWKTIRDPNPETTQRMIDMVRRGDDMSVGAMGRAEDEISSTPITVYPSDAAVLKGFKGPRGSAKVDPYNLYPGAPAKATPTRTYQKGSARR